MMAFEADGGKVVDLLAPMILRAIKHEIEGLTRSEVRLVAIQELGMPPDCREYRYAVIVGVRPIFR